MLPEVAEERTKLLHKRANIKRRVTNLIKKVTALDNTQEKDELFYVSVKQYSEQLSELDRQFQDVHEQASLLVADNQETLEQDMDELDEHDSRVSTGNIKLRYFIGLNVSDQQSNVPVPATDTKSVTSSNQARFIQSKFKRIHDGVNSLVAKLDDATKSTDDYELEDLQGFEQQLSGHNKSLEELLRDVEGQPMDIDDPDGDNINDQFDALFEQIKTSDAKLSDLKKNYRRDRKLKQQKEKEELVKKQEEDKKRHELEIEKYRNEVKSALEKTSSERTGVKLPDLKIPEFDGEPTNWKTYWQQFEATIHSSKKLDDQLKMQYLLKSLITKRAKDAVQGIVAVAEAYPEAISALKARFDRPQIIHRAHVRSLLQTRSLKDGSSSELRQLHDTFQHNLRSLKALNQLNFDQFITALAETKFDPTTMIEWQKHCQNEKEVPGYEKLLQFLDLRATATELTNFEPSYKRSTNAAFVKKPTNYSNSSANAKSVSTFVTETEVNSKCTVCNGGKHRLAYCPQFKKKNSTERRIIVSSQRACFNCLRNGHVVKDCPSENRCRTCDQHHHTLIHVDTPATSASTADLQASGVSKPTNTPSNTTASTATSYVVVPDSATDTALMMTAEVILYGPDGIQTNARVLLDPASSASFVTERIAQQLRLPRQRQNISINGIGGVQCPNVNNTVVRVDIKSAQNSVLNVSAIVLPSLTRQLPSTSIPLGEWPHLSSLKLADPEFNTSKPIDMLLGVDVYQDIIKTGVILGPRNTPSAQETIFGWVLFGNTTTTGNTHTQLPQAINALHTLIETPTCEQLLHKFWSLEEVPCSTQPLSLKDQATIKHFNETVSRDSKNGRYEVRLPIKHNAPILGESRPQALRRFLSLERRLNRSNQFKDYAKVVNEYFASQHAELVPDCELNKHPSFYLAHHAVRKDSVSTPLRVVFDGSVKSSTGASVNDLLIVGPTVHPPLNDVLLRFRLHPYTMTTDVSKMYRAVGLQEVDRDLHRFLWRDSPDEPVKDYRMNRVTFGIASSAFLATNTMQHLANLHEQELPLASTAVRESFYVDDGLFSVATKDKAVELHHQLQTLFNNGGFKLHKWNSNSKEVLASFSSDICSQDNNSAIGESEDFVKTLGIEYNANQDVFKFTASTHETDHSAVLTKRLMLSDSSKIFDPLGLISCVTITVKIYFQQLWEQDIQWDDPLPTQLQQDWLTWRKELPLISALRIPRCFTPLNVSVVSRQLIGFSDASEKAYCGVVYLRSIDTAGGVHMSIVIAKTKVAPLKRVSLPRLELCGALMLARLLKHCQEVLKVPTCDIRAFTDSTIVLYWIHGSSQCFKTFEANRISETQQLVPPELWNHVSGTDNPADAGSRGVLPHDIINHNLWWQRPNWLKHAESTWPQQPNFKPTLESLVESGINVDILQHKKGIDVNTHAVNTTPTIIDPERFSNYQRLLRVTSLVFRVVKRQNLIKSVPITTQELHHAEAYLIKESQRKSFSRAIELLKMKKQLLKGDSLLPLNPFLDSDGILRVGGRLSQSNLSYQARHPIILHGKDHLAALIIEQEHKRLCHAGPKLTLGSLQERYHIIGARRIVRQHTRNCKTCKRTAPKTVSQLMGQVPEARVCPTFVNERVSVDYAGPLTIKSGNKRRPIYANAYAAIFVCMETKACHIELVSDLTADTFLAALRRFVSRRGKPKEMWSDNGTQFTRTNKDLKELYESLKQDVLQNKVSDWCSTQGIQWHFSPPTGPHHGSVWENGVKSCKFHLKRIIGNNKLTFEELTTTLSQIEACMNSRPITTSVDSNDDDGISPLTPGHFLIGRPMEAIPNPPDAGVTKITTLKRWRLCQTLVHHFWKRWYLEYLNGLQRMSKWKSPQRNLKIGDIVLIKDNRTSPGQWPIAKVTNVNPGPDNNIRVASVTNSKGTYLRPIVKLCLLLPVEEQ
eukprot:gene10236-11286_t